MLTVAIRELKDRLSQHLRMVRRGEEILVTEMQVLTLDTRIRDNAGAPGFDTLPES